MNVALGTLLLFVSLAAVPEDLRVLPRDGGGAPPEAMLQLALRREAYAALDKRRAAYEQRTTVEQWRAYQDRTQDFFREQLGGFPEPTPLNARTVGALQGEGYHLEKVIYDSRPNHPVTAILYLPETKPPYPAVLIACGHSKTGKAAAYNQRIGIMLAKNGLAALCYDPIGQGERSQILDAAGRPKHASSTREHFLVGVGSILVGTNTAQYRIYDGMRGIDYLVERDDIDGKRIGCTGCSGGGTLTSYIMALDKRVTCAAPACYLTTWRKLLETIGPQDAEQNIFGQIAYGMDHADFVFMRAPRPTLICSTTDDFFNIDGTWDTFRQAKRVYTRLGFPERVDLVEVAGKHGIPREGREAMTRWMRRWLLGIDDAVTESDFPVWNVEQLQCTPKGQVQALPGVRSVFELNVARELELAARRQRVWRDSEPAAMRQAIRKLAAIRPLKEIAQPKLRELGSIARKGYRIQKMILQPSRGIVLPALAFLPDEPSAEAVLFLDGAGKATAAAPGGELDRLARAGHPVLAVDLRGLGETGRGNSGDLVGPDWKTYFTGYLLGRSIVGMRAEDTLIAARFMQGDRFPRSKTETGSGGASGGGQRGPVKLIAIGLAGIPALHAAALEPQLFSSVELRRTLRSWVDVVRTPEANNQLVNTVHNGLSTYDLPNLESLYGRQQLVRRQAVDATGALLPK